MIFLGKDAEQIYAETARLVSNIAAWLFENGFKWGDNVAIFFKNRPEYLILHFGILHAGGLIPVNAKLHSKEAA